MDMVVHLRKGADLSIIKSPPVDSSAGSDLHSVAQEDASELGDFSGGSPLLSGEDAEAVASEDRPCVDEAVSPCPHRLKEDRPRFDHRMGPHEAPPAEKNPPPELNPFLNDRPLLHNGKRADPCQRRDGGVGVDDGAGVNSRPSLLFLKEGEEEGESPPRVLHRYAETSGRSGEEAGSGEKEDSSGEIRSLPFFPQGAYLPRADPSWGGNAGNGAFPSSDGLSSGGSGYIIQRTLFFFHDASSVGRKNYRSLIALRLIFSSSRPS